MQSLTLECKKSKYKSIENGGTLRPTVSLHIQKKGWRRKQRKGTKWKKRAAMPQGSTESQFGCSITSLPQTSKAEERKCLTWDGVPVQCRVWATERDSTSSGATRDGKKPRLRSSALICCQKKTWWTRRRPGTQNAANHYSGFSQNYNSVYLFLNISSFICRKLRIISELFF